MHYVIVGDAQSCETNYGWGGVNYKIDNNRNHVWIQKKDRNAYDVIVFDSFGNEPMQSCSVRRVSSLLSSALASV